MLLPLIYRAPYWVQQWCYKRYFRSNDVAFYLDVYGQHEDFYAYDYYYISKGSSKESDRILLTLGKKFDSELSFLDIDGDGIPEIHISGYDPREPGVNYFKFDKSTKTFSEIPMSQIPQKWKDKYPEDETGDQRPWYDFWD